MLLILGTLLVTFPAFYARARAEERLLRGQFGSDYERYMDEVPMLVPGLRRGRGRVVQVLWRRVSKEWRGGGLSPALIALTGLGVVHRPAHGLSMLER